MFVIVRKINTFFLEQILFWLGGKVTVGILLKKYASIGYSAFVMHRQVFMQKSQNNPPLIPLKCSSMPTRRSSVLYHFFSWSQKIATYCHQNNSKSFFYGKGTAKETIYSPSIAYLINIKSLYYAVFGIKLTIIIMITASLNQFTKSTDLFNFSL